MKGSSRVAIIGGGISGLATAWQLTQNEVEWKLFEASDRLGGIVETVRTQGFLIECGPDSWVTEKPWARALAEELGLADQIISSNDSRRRTFVQRSVGRTVELVPVPDGMRMMVPSQWGPLLDSPLFDWQARLAYLREPKRAAELKAAVPEADESVASFVRRHFGKEVADSIAHPLLSAVFGGDITRLSVRAVMPAFVRMEASHGSLIHAVQEAIVRRGEQLPEPIFTTLAGGLQVLVDALVSRLSTWALHLRTPVARLERENSGWHVRTDAGNELFDAVVVTTPTHATRGLLESLGSEGALLAGLLPEEASSAIVVALAFAPEEAARMRVPRGFGYVVPPAGVPPANGERPLLACTFVDQKFPGRAPEGGVLLRAFFGGPSADELLQEDDEALTERARAQLARTLGPLPKAAVAIVRRWPRSMPQYAVGHPERMQQLEQGLLGFRGLHLVGNSYHGVGLPDLIRQGRAVAARLQSRW